MYIFTFGFGHELQGKFQPVIADSMEEARFQIIKVYGNRWAFSYTNEEFNEAKEQGIFLDLKPLKPICIKEAV